MKWQITVENEDLFWQLLGKNDEYLKLLNDELLCRVVARGQEIMFDGEEAGCAHSVVQTALNALEKGRNLTAQEFKYLIYMAKTGKDLTKAPILAEVLITPRGKRIQGKTLGQQEYLRILQERDIVFGLGPAGTGKTYLAVAVAVLALKNKLVSRLILTRPAVEAGEKLGFLPGDMQEKVDPYLRPLYDALYEFLGEETFQKYMEKGIIEVAPLAFMRGRTLDDAYIILDEAQNTTPEQIKMFLTRLGFGSKMVITGDLTQIDLPINRKSGLQVVQDILKDIPGIEFVYLTDQDVVRHDLVQKIIDAYQKYDEEQQG
ncbi:MAG: PhoH family protein [bacterium]